MGRNVACPGAVGLAAHLLAFILNSLKGKDFCTYLWSGWKWSPRFFLSLGAVPLVPLSSWELKLLPWFFLQLSDLGEPSSWPSFAAWLSSYLLSLDFCLSQPLWTNVVINEGQSCFLSSTTCPFSPDPPFPGQHITVVSDLVNEWPFYPDTFWFTWWYQIP